MKKLFAILPLVLLLCFTFSCQKAEETAEEVKAEQEEPKEVMALAQERKAIAELTTSQIAQKYSPSVVTIIALDKNNQPISLGSGFFISSEGDVVTNHHVLEGSSKAIIKTKTGEKGELLEIIKSDPDLDLIIAKTSLNNTKPLPIGDSDTVLVGIDIVAIGNPEGLEGTVSKGIISGIRETESFKVLQITAPISPGSSGGPVFNLSGKVIGVATAYLDKGQSLNFAMPVNYLKILKQTKLKLASLQKKKKSNAFKEDNSLVEIFAVHYKYGSWDEINLIDFGIRNLSNYTIRNIKLFFVYKNNEGEILSYSDKEIKRSILPHLALQFSHHHSVRDFRERKHIKWLTEEVTGQVEIRILDYEIDRY